MEHGPAPRAMKQSEIVAREITNRIVAGDLPEGTRLPIEKAMLEEYQVGRSTLREALRLLESRGVLSIRSGRDGGPIVRKPRPSDLGEVLTLMMQFEGVSFSEVFAARQTLAPRLARRAAEKIKPATLAALRECLERMNLYLDEPTVFHAERRRFQELVVGASDSPVLEMLCNAVGSVAEGLAHGFATGQFTRPQRVAMAAGDQEIYDALAARDPNAVEAAVAAQLTVAAKKSSATHRSLTRRPVQWAPLAEMTHPSTATLPSA